MNHHYLPQVYLRKFEPKRGPLFIFDKQSRTWAESSAKKACAIPDLYSWLNKDGTFDDQRVERVFWPTENSLGILYEELRQGRLSDASGPPFLMLISSMAVRVPSHLENTRASMHAHFNSFFHAHRQELEDNCFSRGVPREAFATAKVNPHPNAVLAEGLAQIKPFTDIIINYDWVFFRAAEGQFITSDRPVTIDGPRLGHPETMVVFTLSRNFAAIGRIGTGISTRFDEIKSEGIKAINGTILEAAPRYIIASTRDEQITA